MQANIPPRLTEFSGTLLGFDDYVNMVLEDVTEFDYSGENTKLPKILLNGNNVCMVSHRHLFSCWPWMGERGVVLMVDRCMGRCVWWRTKRKRLRE